MLGTFIRGRNIDLKYLQQKKQQQEASSIPDVLEE
jgi:hypothetical protein